MRFKKLVLAVIVCGLFLIGDQVLKWQAWHGWGGAKLVGGMFGWQPFFNYGVAFGFPLPNWLVVLFTIPILVFLIYLIVRQGNLKNKIGLILIFTGAVSNLVDRIFLHHTVDYLRFFTGVINLADVLIGIGFVLIFLRKKEEAVW